MKQRNTNDSLANSYFVFGSDLFLNCQKIKLGRKRANYTECKKTIAFNDLSNSRALCLQATLEIMERFFLPLKNASFSDKGCVILRKLWVKGGVP